MGRQDPGPKKDEAASWQWSESHRFTRDGRLISEAQLETATGVREPYFVGPRVHTYSQTDQVDYQHDCHVASARTDATISEWVTDVMEEVQRIRRI